MQFHSVGAGRLESRLISSRRFNFNRNRLIAQRLATQRLRLFLFGLPLLPAFAFKLRFLA